MVLNLGDTAPNFKAVTTAGSINFYDWLDDKWGLLFSHPEDYTPVCTTELGLVAKLKEEFEKRNVNTIALSVDPIASHKGWVKDIEELIDGNCSGGSSQKSAVSIHDAVKYDEQASPRKCSGKKCIKMGFRIAVV